jgi:hypothetical protein
MIRNQIVPEVEIIETIKEEKKQKEKIVINSLFKRRKNNRKNTKGRYTQFVQCIDDSVFPPVLFTRTIKHFRGK